MRVSRVFSAISFGSIQLLTSAALAQSINLQDIASVAKTLPQATIYVANKVITMDDTRPQAQAIAVVGDRIIGVGTLEELEQAAQGQPYHIDRQFEDKVLLPGFVEPHVHPLLAALTLSMDVIAIEDWDTVKGFSPAVRDAEGYRVRLKEAIAAHDPAQPFMTWGYHHYFHGEMSRDYLDELAPKTPVILWHRSAHEFYLNTAALKLTKIDEAFVKTLSESAQKQTDLARGHFYEQAMFGILGKLSPVMANRDRILNGMSYAESFYHRNGITTAAEPGGLYSRAVQDYANMVHAEGPLNHYFIPDGKSLYGLYKDDPEGMIAATEETLTWGQGQSRFLPKQVKLFADGAMYSQLMQMRDGYTDGHDGEWIMYPQDYAKAFHWYWDAGYQAHIHTNGDGGLDLVLTTLKAAMRRNPRFDHRTTIEHFGFAAQDQIADLTRLGAVVSANPYYVNALGTRYSEVGIGPERAAMMVPLKSAYEAGLPVAFHSDMPMAPARPLFLVWAAVNRVTAEGDVIGPDERLDVMTALRGITIDAAYSLQLEGEIGSIVPGKFANFAVLEQDPTRVDPMELSKIAIWGTVFEGRVQPVSNAAPQKVDQAMLPFKRPKGPIIKAASALPTLALGSSHSARLCLLQGHAHGGFHVPRAVMEEFAQALVAE